MLRLPDKFVALVVEPVWDLYERSVRLQTFRDLARSQWFDDQQLQDLQARRLNSLVKHAVTSTPIYARRFAEAGINPDKVWDIADLSSLPLLTKQDVRHHLDELLSRQFETTDLVPAKTGGSTGVALGIYCDRRGVQRRAGAALRADHWSGWRLGQPVAAVWGNPPVPRTWRNKLRRTVKDRMFFLDTMHIDDPSIDKFVQDWQRWRPGLLYGHAHSLFILAEALAEHDIVLRPDGVVATSMMLLTPERVLMEKVFGVSVTNRYGCEEVSLIACECEEHRGLHLNTEHAWVEFLDEAGDPCPPGKNGRIVVTELVNLGMPMIRYEVGDHGVPTDRDCPCGRKLPLMEEITGRTADFLVAADGSRVAGISLIENTLTALPGIVQLQLVQNRRLGLDVNLVAGAGYSSAAAAALTDRLRDALGREFDVSIHLVEAIAQERTGKYRFSICNIDY